VSDDEIWNLDEVALYYVPHSKRVVVAKNTKRAVSKLFGREGICTIMLCCSASGRKAKPMIVVEKTKENREQLHMSEHPGTKNDTSNHWKRTHGDVDHRGLRDHHKHRARC
jgi:hypothetical protein